MGSFFRVAEPPIAPPGSFRGNLCLLRKTSRLVSAVALLAEMALPLYCSNHLDRGLLPVRLKGKYGYIDSTGKLLIEPQFESTYGFYEGLAQVKVGGKWGFIDETGKMVIIPQFDKAGSFSEGLAQVTISGKYGFIDKTGKIVILPQYEDAGSFSDGLAAVKMTAKWGYIDKVGDKFIGPNYDKARSFHEGLAAVQVEGKWGYIEKSGGYTINPEFDDVGIFSDELAAARAGGKWGYIDRKGTYVITPQFSSANTFSEGRAPVGVSGPSQANGRNDNFGYIDKTGRFVITPQFDVALPFSDGLAVVAFGRNEGLLLPKWVYIDQSGKSAIPGQFSFASNFIGGLAEVGVFSFDDYGYIDKTGSYVWKASAVDPDGRRSVDRLEKMNQQVKSLAKAAEMEKSPALREKTLNEALEKLDVTTGMARRMRAVISQLISWYEIDPDHADAQKSADELCRNFPNVVSNFEDTMKLVDGPRPITNDPAFLERAEELGPLIKDTLRKFNQLKGMGFTCP